MPSVLITTEGGPMTLDLAALRIGHRLPASWGEVERCRVWQLDAFGRSEWTGDAALQTYVLALVVEVWHPLQRLLRPWRRWPRWLQGAVITKDGRILLRPWRQFGYRACRGPRRSRRHRRVRGLPPLAG